MKHTQPIILIIGTRPEGIKMAPVYHALKRKNIPVVVCSTMQHDQLLTDVLELFTITPEYELNIMRQGQDLFYITQSILQKTKEVLIQTNPAFVLVQGDTTSSMAAALAAFYLHIPVGHIEAGLRTNDIQSPFPEEMNRRMISVIATYHFTPTQATFDNVIFSGIRPEQVFCTGNTVTDALRIVREKFIDGIITIDNDIYRYVELCKKKEQKILLLTIHRRESFGNDIIVILQTIKKILQNNPNLFCFYPYHPNPNVIQALNVVDFSSINNILLCEPLIYKDMVYVLNNANVIITDSGGIQEEAISLSKPVLVLREKTERNEGVLTGLAYIVGANPEKIETYLVHALSNYNHYAINDSNQKTYGDGYAAEKIVSILEPLLIQDTCYNLMVDSNTFNKNYITTQLSGKKEYSACQKDKTMQTVCVIGLGYIGLPTAIIIAEHGWRVIGVDIDTEKVKCINNGDPVIYEPEIYEKLQIVLGNNSFYATTTIPIADYFIIAVPTPVTKEKTADLRYVYAAIESLASVLKKGDTISIESTIPVGTTKKIADILQKKIGLQAGQDFYLVHSPERVLPGKIFYEIVHNDRILGGINTISLEKIKYLYKQFVQGQLYLTDTETAEMVKLVENSSRDVEVAFAHQVASMALAQGLNPYHIIELANKHPRVNILQPSCGVGGHCLAVDPWFLVETFPEQTLLLRTAREVNDAKRDEIIDRILCNVDEWYKKNTKRCTIALLGLSYKPNIDDLRESPALYIAQQLLAIKKIDIFVCEPHIKTKNLPKELQHCAITITKALEQADIIVFLVAHTRFKAIDKKLITQKIVIDACGILYTSSIEQVEQKKSIFFPAQNIMNAFIIDEHEHHSLTYKDKQ